MTHHSHPENSSDAKNQERRRTDWQQNDRRQLWPWVADINDRRSGFARRVEAMRPHRRD